LEGFFSGTCADSHASAISPAHAAVDADLKALDALGSGR
jgi:hypothetical protein